MRIGWWSTACLSLVMSIVACTAAADQKKFEGSWHGAISLPEKALHISVELDQSAEGWQGTIDIPQQGANGIALHGIAIEGSEVRFEISMGSGEPTFNGRLADGRIRGTFEQGGNSLPFFLSREPIDTPKPLTEEQAIEVIDGHLAAYNAHDIEALLGYFHPEIEVYSFPNELLAEGLDALRQGFSFDNKPHESVLARIVEDNHVIDKVEQTVQMDGSAKTNRSTVIYTLEDGLIRRMTFL